MKMFQRVTIRGDEVGLQFSDGAFKGVLSAGRHRLFDPFGKLQVDIVNVRDPWLVHGKLDLLIESGLLRDRITVVDLKDHQRGLVWIDGRFARILAPGLYAYWNGTRDVRVELVDARTTRFDHEHARLIVNLSASRHLLDVYSVERHHVGLLFIDGHYADTLQPGLYAFWKSAADARVISIDMRELTVEVSGQEIITSDKVTLRLNALVTYRVVDARKSVSTTEDLRQTLYRDSQLALRAVVGTRELDLFLSDKDSVAREVTQALRERAVELGVEVISVGIRDLILPGEMRELMNKVTEAKKAAEANLIARREETAAMRSQSNTAKLLADNPTLMRLRELEVLEKIASAGHLKVVLGEKGLTDRLVNVL